MKLTSFFITATLTLLAVWTLTLSQVQPVIITGITFNVRTADAEGNTHVLTLNGVSNRIYKNCIFDGDNVKLDNCRNITFDSCIIRNAKRTSGAHHALNVGSCDGLTFINSTIEDCTDAAQLYNVPNLRFENNTIRRVNYGVKASLFA